MNRYHLTPAKRRAMHVLDMVRNGIYVSPAKVLLALLVTGDAV